MIDEFSLFARMPQPEFKKVDLIELCRQSMFLERNRFPDIDYELQAKNTKIMISCDRQQIDQTLTNILKNAAESITFDSGADPEFKGNIILNLERKDSKIFLSILDNGRGFSEVLIDRISEPYFTTREHGTGLGLAIATKIVEDHEGEILLRNNKKGGAEVVLVFNEFD